MPQTNFERLIELADTVFSTRTDPDQLDVNQEVLAQLEKIHPSCVSEWNEEDGPVSWVLMFPTTQKLMYAFLNKEISEKQLYELTPLHAAYDCIYLCSALVLEEYRRKGIASKLSLEAISEIRKKHPIQHVFVWAFTEEGNQAADYISKACQILLLKRIQ